jgi:hypothetical protein
MRRFGDIRGALAAAAELGRLDVRHVDTFAHLMLTAVNEMALLVARSAEPAAPPPGAEDGVQRVRGPLLP